MKCSELEADITFVFGEECRAYNADKADAAIAELKARIQELESMPHTDNSAVIERLSNENERLVKCCKEYDSRQRIDETIKFNGAKQLRATKRALWLARGYIMTLLQKDFQRLAYQCNNDDFKINLLRRRNRYYELSEKCLKKAEENK